MMSKLHPPAFLPVWILERFLSQLPAVHASPVLLGLKSVFPFQVPPL